MTRVLWPLLLCYRVISLFLSTGGSSRTCTSAFSISKVSSVQLLSRVRLFVTPWTVARQASLSMANSRSLLRLMSVESVMPSNHLILCHPLLLLLSIFPSIRVFSNVYSLFLRSHCVRSFLVFIFTTILLSHCESLSYCVCVLLLVCDVRTRGNFPVSR